MSTEIVRNDNYSITRFYGGDKRGVCIQVTPQKDQSYIQLTKPELIEFISNLQKIEKEV